MDLTTVISTISTILITLFTGLLYCINKKQADIQKKQNQIWHKANYPDTVITDFSQLKNEIPEIEISIYNRSDFSLMLKSISSEDSKFKFYKSDPYYETHRDVNIHVYAKDTYELHRSASAPNSPSVERKEPIDRKTQRVYFEISQTNITLKLEFLMPILDTHIIADLKIYERDGKFNYAVTYREN